MLCVLAPLVLTAEGATMLTALGPHTLQPADPYSWANASSALQTSGAPNCSHAHTEDFVGESFLRQQHAVSLSQNAAALVRNTRVDSMWTVSLAREAIQHWACSA